MRRLNYFLLDLDGTLILGNRVLEGAVEFISELLQMGKKFLILTNNSSRSTLGYARFLRAKGFPITTKHVFTSGKATAIYLKEKKIKDAYILGTSSVLREFLSYGIKYSPRSANLVLTYDTTLNFGKISHAARILQRGTGIYVASHPDNVCPVEDGFVPDVGSFIALLKEATGKEPDFIPGKPSQYFFSRAMEIMGAREEETAIIGDRLSTDIKTGIDFGITSILLLTGETSLEDLRSSQIRPDMVFRNLRELLAYLRNKK